MKQAKVYESKIKKLLKDAPKSAKVEGKDDDPITILIQSILEANADDKQAADAFKAILEEFVDYNELRVAPIKDIVECLDQGIDEEYPKARGKAEMIRESLGHLFNKHERITLEHLEKANKKDQRRLLSEMHLNEYAVAKVLLRAYDRHAVPVDENLFETLIMDELVHPETDIADTQAFLERVIAQKDVESAHVFLRKYVLKRFNALSAKREKEAEEKRKIEEAQAAKRAEAEKKAQAQKEAESEQKSKKKKSTGKKKKATEKTSDKKSTASRKSGRKSSGKSSKKSSRRSSGSKKSKKK